MIVNADNKIKKENPRVAGRRQEDRALFFLSAPFLLRNKRIAICGGFGSTGEAGSAPAEQKLNLECSSKGC